MNIKNVSIVAILSSAVIFAGCSNNDNEPGKINDQSKQEKKEDKQDHNSNKQKDNKNNKDNKDENQQKEKKSDKKVDQRKEKVSLNTAISNADKLHDFIVQNSDFYTDLKDDLSDQGIKLADDYSSPYIDNAEPGDEQSYVFAGIITDKQIDKKSDQKAIITYKIRSGLSNGITADGHARDVQDVGKDIQDKLKDKKFSKNEKTVRYEVTLNKDQTTATIKKLTNKDWSIN